MERVIARDDYGNIACNGIIIYSNSNANLERDISDFSKSNWKVIIPKYYRYMDDNCIVEIWYDNVGILLDNGLNRWLEIGMIIGNWNDKGRIQITYEKAMQMLERKNELSYNNKDLMSRIEDELEQENKELRLDTTKAIEESKGNLCCEIEAPTVKQNKIRGTKEQYKEKDYILEDDKQNNNGGATDYYALPRDANTLQDLIEHRNMNGSVKDIFKACYRLGIKTEDELRDLNKMAYYSLREIGRITARKDYITIAKELMGSQAIEKDKTIFKGLK